MKDEAKDLRRNRLYNLIGNFRVTRWNIDKGIPERINPAKEFLAIYDASDDEEQYILECVVENVFDRGVNTAIERYQVLKDEGEIE